jgi:hypothetical protein
MTIAIKPVSFPYRVGKEAKSIRNSPSELLVAGTKSAVKNVDPNTCTIGFVVILPI